MTISFECPSCFRRLKVPDKAAGKRLKCPACSETVTVPASDEDDEFSSLGDDDSSSYGSPMPPRKGSKSPQKTASKPAVNSSPSVRKLHPAIIPAVAAAGGLLLGMVAMWLMGTSSSDQPVVTNSGTEQSASTQEIISEPNTAVDNTPAAATPSKPAGQQSHQLADGPAPAEAVREMIALLESRDYKNFLLHYAPVETLRVCRTQDGMERALAELPTDELLKFAKALSNTQPVLNTSGLIATFRETAVSSAPAPVTIGEGYGSELPTVIDNAVADLEAGRLQQFVEKMFPPEAIKLMQLGGAGNSRMDAMTANSTLVVRMLEDLKLLKSGTPKVQGDVAEYTIPPQQYSADDLRRIRPNPNGPEPPDRRVRFSRINGHWRFYAGVSEKQISQSLSGGPVNEMELERIGTGWRLSKMPRI